MVKFNVIAQEVLKLNVIVQGLHYNIINLHYALGYNNPCAITFNFSTSCTITLNLTI